MWIRKSVVLIVGLLLTGCATKAVPEIIYKDRNNIVRIETRPPDAAIHSESNFQHPLELSEEDLTHILQSIRVQKSPGMLSSFFKKRSPPSKQAFTQEEARQMAAPLHRAFRKVKPDERIAFLFTHTRGRFLSGVTSGVMFVKKNRLHLILGRYQSSSRPHEKDIALSDSALPMPPYTGFRLSKGPYQKLINSDESPVWQEPIGIQHWVMIDFQALIKTPPDPELFPILSESEDTEAEETRGPVTGIKEKLRLLKQLQDEDLITQEEYEKKRKELIEEF